MRTSDSDHLSSAVGRRRFLQRAVMGALAVPLTPSLLNPLVPSEQGGKPNIEIISGILAASSMSSVDITTNGQHRRITLATNAAIWKGGETTPASLRNGDDVMIRIVNPAGTAVRLWANLSRVRGVVVGWDKGGYVVQTGGNGTPKQNLLLELSPQATFGDAANYAVTGANPSLAIGFGVDAIGEQIPGGIRATLLYFAPGSPSGPALPQKPRTDGTAKIQRVSNGPLTMCYYSYNGYASWFDCANGAGRCTTCDTSNQYQLAWPALDTCGCCSVTCCDCSKNCVNQVYLSCGSHVNVSDACSSNKLGCTVVSCGPCQEANCSGCTPARCGASCSDCAGYTNNIVDLTKPTFAYFYDPATRGCFSCSVNTTVTC
ncbi:MAG: hypothetical protein ACREOS_07250 [Candidatus Dormibacteraceae bacterium]